MTAAARRVADTASVPSNAVIARAADRQSIDGWIGYLPSPYAAVSWSAVDLGRVLTHAGRLLPVYVGPYDAKTLSRMNPDRDARQCLDDLHNLTEPHHGLTLVCLDIEPGAWAASPADTLSYFAHFRAVLRGAGLDTAPYAAPGTLLGLGQRYSIDWVWCASWRAKYGATPKPLWPTDITPPGLGNAWEGRRAWQQAGGVRLGRIGTRADLSLFPADFPLIVHGTQPAPKPPSTPTRAPGGANDTPPGAPSTASVSVTVDGHTFTGRIPRT